MSSPVQLIRRMFAEMVEAKDVSVVGDFYHPGFELTTNGSTQDLAAFIAGHEAVYPTAITYAVAYDEDAWVESADRVAGRVWITIQRPGESATPIEVIFLATIRDGLIHRLWDLTWPDWSQLEAFGDYDRA